MDEVELRPTWWRIAVAAWAGVMIGGLVGGWLVDVSFYLTDQVTGREGGPEDFDSIQWYDFLLMYSLWVVIFVFMQFCAARMSRWTKTVWAAAALQSALMILFVWVGGWGFIPGVLLPWAVASLLVRTRWLSSLVRRDRARHAARFPSTPH